MIKTKKILKKQNEPPVIFSKVSILLQKELRCTYLLLFVKCDVVSGRDEFCVSLGGIGGVEAASFFVVGDGLLQGELVDRAAALEGKGPVGLSPDFAKPNLFVLLLVVVDLHARVLPPSRTAGKPGNVARHLDVGHQ